MNGKMFDNKDYPTEWALNPSSYRNMDNDQVDWAALAQEWIKMKETNIPSAPTPPSISENPTSSSFGGGEAPMDMEFKDDEIPPAPPAPNISGADNWNRWNQWESNWNQASVGLGSTNWDWNNVSPEANETLTRIPNNLMIPPPAPVISSSAFVDHGALGSTVPLESSSLSSSFGYHTMNLPRSHFNNQVPSSGFWNSEQHPRAPGTTSSPFLKDMRPGITRIPPSSATIGTLPTMDMITSRNRDVKEKTPENDTLNTLDTIKRKQLPAWIREGLEKMEREKQKAIERERQAVLRKQELEACKKIKDQARAVLSPDKSKFDSDSEKELPEYEFRDIKDISKDDLNKLQKANCDQGSPDITRPRKTRFRDASSPEKLSNVEKLPNTDVNTNNSTASIGPCLRMNKEELLQSLMLKVRRSLTEILLEVTNDEIISTCEEVWKNVHNKGKILTTSSGHTAPLAQITRRLGLGIYSDSDSDESSDEHLVQNQSEKSMSSKNDSDEELKETVRLRQQAFKKTEAEIEASLAEEEENMKGEDQLAKNKKADILFDRKDRMISNDKNKHRTGHAVQESNKNWKENCNRDNDNLAAGNRKSSLHNDDEKPPSDIIASKSTSRSTPDRFNQGEESSSSESGNHSGLSKRKQSYGSNNGKNNTSSSPRKRSARSSDNTKRYSSSRSRSRSKNDSSSRDNSCESSTSKLYANSVSTDRTVKKDESKSENYKSSREVSKKCKSLKNAQYGKPRSRSTSQSDAHFRSESRSRSRSRSKSRSRTRSNSTVRSRQKRSRSRSWSSFRRQHRNRSDLHSRSRHRSRSQSQSRSRSISPSRSKSRSRKRSKSSYKSTGTGQKSEGVKRRSTRSRSSERTRRSRSNTRKSKNSHRQRHHHYERDRSSKKSIRHHVD